MVERRGGEASLRMAATRPVAARDGLATRARGSAAEWHGGRAPRRRNEVRVELRRYSLVQGGWWLWLLGTEAHELVTAVETGTAAMAAGRGVNGGRGRSR